METAVAAGQDIEPLLTGLREQLVQAGVDEGMVDEFLELHRNELESTE